MLKNNIPRRWLGWASALLLVAASCAAQSPAAEVPVSAGQARIWFYRDWQPSESLNVANIDVNGSYFGSVANGGVFSRDVPPGRYHIAPQSYGQDFNQDKDVDLVSGQQVYCKIASLRGWQMGVGGDESGFDRDTFYIWLMAPELARAEIARDRSGI